MKKEKFTVAIDIGWIEEVSASNVQEAIKLTEQKYKWGRGRIPREYIEVSEESDILCGFACQVED